MKNQGLNGQVNGQEKQDLNGEDGTEPGRKDRAGCSVMKQIRTGRNRIGTGRDATGADMCGDGPQGQRQKQG